MRHLSLLLLLALLASACGQASGSPRTALVINGDEITIADIQPLIRAAGSSVDPATGAPLPEQQTAVQVLSNLALITLIDQQVQERGGDPVDEADVDAALEGAIAGAGGQEAFEQGLAAQGGDILTVRLEQRFQLGVDRLGQLLADEVEVSDDEVQTVYETRFALPEVSHILVGTEEEALAALERIDGGEDFAAVAQELSTDPGSGPAGGALGLLQPGAFVPEFEEAAQALQPGEVSQPVETQFGFHLITTTEPQALTDELREQIATQLVDQQVQGRLTDVVFGALLDADATINPRFGRWAPEVSPEAGLTAVIVPADPLGDLVPVPGADSLEVPAGEGQPVDPGAPVDQ